MHHLEHWDILLSNNVNKKAFIEMLLSGKATDKLSYLNSLKGMLFSDIAIAECIEREYRFDTVEIEIEANRKLSSLSSGERKKAFLIYCLKQKPDYLIIDNPLDHLDHESRKSLKGSLENLSQTVRLIQLVNRHADLLPFIQNKAQIKDNSFRFSSINSNKTEQIHFEKLTIPSTTNTSDAVDEVLVQFDAVSVNYADKKIINSISWSIKKGEYWQLVGPNGSGKSTLLAMISGDNPKGYGQNLYLFGKKKGSGETIWEIKHKIGVYATVITDLFQKRETVENMILSGYFDSIGLYTEPTSLQKQTVEKWLCLINMSALKNTFFNQISIGQQRVVLIIRAIIKQPLLVIFDEPLEGLDDENVALVSQLITILRKETTITFICVSHRIESTLAPDLVYELIPSENGSRGKIKEVF